MFKKWLVIGSAAVVLVAAVWFVGLSYASGGEGAGSALAAVSAKANGPAFGELTYVVTLAGQAVEPEDFLTASVENENITAAFSVLPDFDKPGRGEVSLLLTRNGRETITVPADIYIVEPARSVSLEAGISPDEITPEKFLLNLDILDDSMPREIKIENDVSALDLNKFRTYDMELSLNGQAFQSILYLNDTTPPSAKAVSVVTNTGQAVPPEEFVTDVYDLSHYTVRFLNDVEPDWFALERQGVTVVLTDIYNNSAEYKASLNIRPNLKPPVFTGVRNLEVTLGDTVKYRAGIEAADSFGNPLTFTVDSALVDIYTPGAYEVSYTAEDVNGNQTIRRVIVTVAEVSEEVLSEELEAVYASIVAEEMTPVEKARSIFDWVCGHIGYVSDAPKNSVFEGAYRGFQNRSGDCFTFYAVSEVLLTRAGIENMRVTRINGTPTSHYWNLINPDGTGWYHFDATPVRVHNLNRFMFTDAQAREYTDIIYTETAAVDYYTYDAELYPAVMP